MRRSRDLALVVVVALALGLSACLAFQGPGGTPLSPQDQFFLGVQAFNTAASLAEVVEDDPATKPELAQKIDDAQLRGAVIIRAIVESPSPQTDGSYTAAAQALDAIAAELRAIAAAKGDSK